MYLEHIHAAGGALLTTGPKLIRHVIENIEKATAHARQYETRGRVGSAASANGMGGSTDGGGASDAGSVSSGYEGGRDSTNTTPLASQPLPGMQPKPFDLQMPGAGGLSRAVAAEEPTTPTGPSSPGRVPMTPGSPSGSHQTGSGGGRVQVDGYDIDIEGVITAGQWGTLNGYSTK